jgi:hypothetical protein
MLVALSLTFTPAHGASAWFVTGTAQAIALDYSGDGPRETMTGWGVFVSGDHLDDGGGTLGYNRRTVSLAAHESIAERAAYAAARVHRYNGNGPGRLTARVDAYRVEDVASTATDTINVFGPSLAYLSNDRKRYADLGYTASRYRSTHPAVQNLTVRQWTPTVGIAPGAQDWLQLRGYFISHADTRRMAGTRATRAAELKWTHRVAPRNGNGLERIEVGALAGTRMYAVDPDAAEVYSLADTQHEALALGLGWRLGARLRALTMAGWQSYENSLDGRDYSGRYLYAALARDW